MFNDSSLEFDWGQKDNTDKTETDNTVTKIQDQSPVKNPSNVYTPRCPANILNLSLPPAPGCAGSLLRRPLPIPVLISCMSRKPRGAVVRCPRRVNITHLRQLPLASPVTAPDEHPIRMALLNARSVTNKTFLINDLFTSKVLDFLFLTETWQQNMEYSHLNELCPTGCSYISSPRLTGRGGGLAVVFKNRFACRLVNSESYHSFEYQVTKAGRLNPFYCILIYRPPGPPGQFLLDFNDLLSSVIKLDRVLIIGDFNFHIDDVTSKIASDFLEITETFNFVQHVSGPTHIAGHTLDLVFSHGLTTENICLEDFHASDHKCVLFNVSFNLDRLSH